MVSPYWNGPFLVHCVHSEPNVTRFELVDGAPVVAIKSCALWLDDNDGLWHSNTDFPAQIDFQPSTGMNVLLMLANFKA